ncbi:MAG: chemotaxis protein CheX [Treponema sp.]|nr:chemotaxis protein CheX [Treponema sp.]
MEQYIQPFIKVCETVFRDFCQTEVTPGRVFFVTKHETHWDISGIIGLSGDASGAVAISMMDVTAFKIASTLTGAEHTSIDDDVTDAVGELINIIAGNVKKDFEDQLRIKISLPSIVKGKSHTIVWPSEKTRIICIPFTVFSDQEFCLSVAMDTQK